MTKPITKIEASNSLADLAARINVEHKAVIDALKSAVVHAMACGDALAEAKAKVPHGQWLPWLDKHCRLSQRSVQLYVQLAKHRELIEKEMAKDKSATGVADLSLREAAALCVLAGRLERFIDFAKRAEGCNPEQLVDLCIAEGFGLIQDKGYDPFHGRSKAEIREWILFGLFIGNAEYTHIEWLLQGGSNPAFQNVDGWLGPAGSAWRKPYVARLAAEVSQGVGQVQAEYADKTFADIKAEIVKLNEGAMPYVLAVAAKHLSDDAHEEAQSKEQTEKTTTNK